MTGHCLYVYINILRIGDNFKVVFVVSVDLRFRLPFHINCIDDLSVKQFLLLKWKPSFLRLCCDKVDLQTVIHTGTVGLVKRTECGSRCARVYVCA